MRKILLLWSVFACLLPGAMGQTKSNDLKLGSMLSNSLTNYVNASLLSTSENLSASFTSAGTLPDGWTNEGWTLNEYLDIEDDYYAATTYSTNVKLITPLLEITEGSTFSFEAYNPWDDSFAVYISADGENWTSIYTVPITGTEMVTNTIEFSSTSDYADYVGGTYYLAFMKSGYAWYNVYIDNVSGPAIYSNNLDQGFNSSTTTTPDGWSNDGWTLNEYLDIADDYYVATTYSTNVKLSTPLLAITEGSTFSFETYTLG